VTQNVVAEFAASLVKGCDGRGHGSTVVPPFRCHWAPTHRRRDFLRFGKKWQRT